MRRKILMGALALALPAGLLAVTQTAAVAKPTTNSISCTGFAATISFGGPETNEGVVTTVHKPGPSTSIGSSTFSCGGGHNNASNGVITIAGGTNAKNPSFNNKSCKATPTNTTVCDKYVENTWDEFAAAGGTLKKSLKLGIGFTVNGHSENVKVKGSSEFFGAPCAGDEVGFTITGQDTTGFYYNKSASILVCLKADLRHDGSHGTFGADFGTDTGGGIVSASINPTDSTATL